MSEPTEYLILSLSRSDGIAWWWNPNSAGYTNDIRRAGRYSEEESAAIVRASFTKDARVPVSVAMELVNRLIVDLGDGYNAKTLASYRHLAKEKS